MNEKKGYNRLTEEMLEEGVLHVNSDDEELINEVFDYNSKIHKMNFFMSERAEALKGYKHMSFILFFGIFALLKVLAENIGMESANWENNSFAMPAIVIYLVAQIYRIVKNKVEVKVLMIAALVMLLVHWLFIGLVVVNGVMLYMYNKVDKKVRNQFGYPKFESVDLNIIFPDGSIKMISGRSMK